MYNDKLQVANKIITDSDLRSIFELMETELQNNESIAREEEQQNEKYERQYQNWSLKGFKGEFKCTFNFYDSTNITVDNFINFWTIFNSRLHEIKDMWVRYNYSYAIMHNGDYNSIIQHINMNIYETKLDIDVSLSSNDDKMNNVYQLIKEKILNAPEKYDRIIKKRSSITSKISFAMGAIPSFVICTLLVFVTMVRQLYGSTYILFPFLAVVLSFVIGSMLSSVKLERLYSPLVPEKKYAGYDSTNHKSIYTDDINKYTSTSEIIIGKNIDNIKNRKMIAELEEKYSKYIPMELLALLVLSIIMIVIGKFV